MPNSDLNLINAIAEMENYYRQVAAMGRNAPTAATERLRTLMAGAETAQAELARRGYSHQDIRSVIDR